MNNNSAVVTVSESWLNADFPDSVVTFPSYTGITRAVGEEESHFMFVILSQKRLTHLQEDEFEALWVWLRPKQPPCGLSCIIAAALYIPPRSPVTAKSDTLTTQYLDRCLCNTESKYQHAAFVIPGDTKRYKSETICNRHDLKQVAAGTTRKASQLDSVFTNIPSMYEPPVHLPPVSTSDHQTIMWNAGKWPSKPIQYINCRKHTPKTMRQLGLLMNTVDFSNIHEVSDPEVQVSVFTSTIQFILDKVVPLKRVSVTDTDKPWMTVQIKHLKKKDSMFLAQKKCTQKTTISYH